MPCEVGTLIKFEDGYKIVLKSKDLYLLNKIFEILLQFQFMYKAVISEGKGCLGPEYV